MIKRGSRYGRAKNSDLVQLKLRFPERLRKRIEAVAKRNGNSMNLEIIARLEESFAKVDRAAEIKAVAEAAATDVMRRYFV